jgi:hypothetical protein
MRTEVLTILKDKLAQHGVKIETGDGTKAANHIYNMTLGKFDKRNKRNGLDVWSQDPKRREFKTFIRREAGKIGAAAATRAKKGEISGKALITVARQVMTKTNRKCKARVVKGQIVGFPYPGKNPGQGDVCTGYLDSF